MSPNSDINGIEGGTGFHNFLVEDLKDTSQHLIETDRKVAFIIRLYGSVFLLISTSLLTLTKYSNYNIGPYIEEVSLIILTILFGFSYWLYLYTIKAEVTKKMYIARMNFLRSEIHNLFNSKNRNLDGFWTVKNIEKSDTEVEHTSDIDGCDSKDEPAPDIGLDRLYTNGLSGLLYLLIIAISLNISYIFMKYLDSDIIGTMVIGSVSLSICLTIGSLFFKMTISDNRKARECDILTQKDRYKIISGSEDK